MTSFQRTVLLALACHVVGPAALSALQDPFADGRSWVLERSVRDRWIHADRHPRFVPFETYTSHIQIHDPGPGWEGALDLAARGNEARVTLDSLHRVRSMQVRPRPLLYRPGSTRRPDRTRRTRRIRLMGSGAAVNLPAARFWEVPFPHPPGITQGSTWADTLAFVSDPGEGLWATLEGIWRHEVVGDTTLDGRTLPIVRTEAEVRYRSGAPEDDEGIDGLFTITHDVRGSIVGRAVVDTALSVRAVGSDTTRWSGTATLRAPEGGSYDSAVQYERDESWLLVDSLEWAVRRDSARARAARERTGMLWLPTNDIQERLEAGDPALADSLAQRWRETDDPNERVEIERLLRRWTARTPEARDSIEARFLRLRAEAGDSVIVELEPLIGSGPTPRLTVAQVERLLPYLDDIGRFWRAGVVPRWEYAQLASDLMASSPLLEPDSSRWACEPAACERLIDVRETATEPRLRDVGLVGAFSRDPGTWADDVRSRFSEGSLVVEEAVLRAEGVATFIPSMESPTIPGPGADWRAWNAWLGTRFRPTHRHALAVYEAVTGRDPLDELEAGWPPASDSARAAIGEILTETGRMAPPDLDEIARILMAENSPLRRRALDDLPRSDASPAPASLAAELLSTLLPAVLRLKDEPWRPAPSYPGEPGAPLASRTATSFHGVRDVPVFLLTDSLPESVVAGRPEGIEPVSQAEWDARDRREGGVLLRLGTVRTAGPFAFLSWDWRVYQRRGPEEAPSGYAGGGDLVLLLRDGEWLAVRSGAWIT